MLRVHRKIGDVASRILDADLLLFRRRGLISIAGRGEYSHAAMAGWWTSKPPLVIGESESPASLMCLEVREWHGGRAVTLASQVHRLPGRIDVYRLQAGTGYLWPYQTRRDALAAMRELCGTDYNYRAILRAALVHLPFARFVCRPNLDDGCESATKFCSGAYSYALRKAGLDPVPNLADDQTEPNDLARSPVFSYQFTLTP